MSLELDDAGGSTMDLGQALMPF